MKQIAVGTIYRVVGANPSIMPVLVLVTGIHADGIVAVTLLSPDVELGGSGDIVLAPAESGLAYQVLVQSDVFGYVFDERRFDRPLGSVAPTTLAALAALRNDDACGRAVAGPPIVQPQDPRWAFKLAELSRLKAAAL